MSSEGCKFCWGNDKSERYFAEEDGYRKSTDRLRIFRIFAWCSIFIALAGLSVKLVYLSSEVEEQRKQLEANHKLLELLLLSLEGNTELTEQKTGGPLSQQEIKESRQNKKSHLENVVKMRSKRSSPRVDRRRRSRKNASPSGPCHLEGTKGPNIISYNGVPRQQPRSTNECILWKRPDVEPPAYCMMQIRDDTDEFGVQYIRIDTTGFYYVYCQLTYQADPWTGTGHRIERSGRNSSKVDILLTATTPPKKFVDALTFYYKQKYDNLILLSLSSFTPVNRRPLQPDVLQRYTTEESQYTGGVFYLNKEDLLAVYPQRAFLKFVMSESKSFFGAMYLGHYNFGFDMPPQ